MNKKIVIGLMVLLFSVEGYAKGRSHGGGSFGTNNDIVDKFPTKKVTNTNNEIPGLRNGESIYINGKVVVRTRNYFWLPTWKNGYADLKVTKKNGKQFKVKEIIIQQVQKEQLNWRKMVNNVGIGYNYDVSFRYDWGVRDIKKGLKQAYAWVSLGISNGRPIDINNYFLSTYKLPIYFTSIRRTYKHNVSNLRMSMRDPSAPVVAFFNVHVTDKLAYAFSITNEWGSGGANVTIPRITVSTF